MCSCRTLIRRSVSLNSYGLFQPSGPNFLRSCTFAWKKQRPYNMRFHARSFELDPKNSGSEIGSLRYDLCEENVT